MEVLEYKYDCMGTRIITCNYCNSKLQIVEPDIEEYDDKYYVRCGFVKCPVCHTWNYVN